MKSLPLHHDFTGRRCLIIGGGVMAGKRARRLIAAGARVDMIAPRVDAELVRVVTASGGRLERRSYTSGDVGGGYALVVAATDDAAVNRRVAEEARRGGTAVNVASDAALGDVIFPLCIDRDRVTISVGSAGTSPQLTRLLGGHIDALVPHAYGALARLVGRYRRRVRQRLPERAARIRFWEGIIEGVVAERVFAGQVAEAERLLAAALDAAPETPAGGEVYLIGAGPGDPDLLTLRAHGLLQRADVVLYDRLVSEEILARLNARSVCIHVGKQRAAGAAAQLNINRMLTDYARQGKRVARLKGGDPFIFGRGGEEIEHLAAQRIPFQVIPGITAASGCACYAGIPLTHRDHAHSVRFVTGQLRSDGVELDWPSLVAPHQTLVFYMSLRRLPVICRNLLAHGMPAAMPMAIVENGTTSQQNTRISTLGEMEEVLAREAVCAPMIVIVGSVVSLHTRLGWFDPHSLDSHGR